MFYNYYYNVKIKKLENNSTWRFFKQDCCSKVLIFKKTKKAEVCPAFFVFSIKMV